jgi:hypothetical protein
LRAVVAHAIDVEAFVRRLDVGGDTVDQRIFAALGAGSSRLITLASSARSVFAPETFSLNTLAAPEASSSASCEPRSCPLVETRAFDPRLVRHAFEEVFIDRGSTNSEVLRLLERAKERAKWKQ